MLDDSELAPLSISPGFSLMCALGLLEIHSRIEMCLSCRFNQTEISDSILSSDWLQTAQTPVSVTYDMELR